MALRFGKKKTHDSDDGSQAKAVAAFEAHPEKARRWFDHARIAADSSQFAYALHNFAAGIKLDPESITAHEAMYNCGVHYSNQGGKPASRNEVKGLDGPHPVEKFAAAEFAWMKDLGNVQLALRFLEASIKADTWVGDVGRWHAPHVLSVLRMQKKKSKASFIQAKDLLAELGAWDEALAAADDALRIDPADATLDSEIKDLSAQRAMEHGRYAEAIGEEGGFKRSVKDMEAQRELEETESITQSASVEERNLERARRDYQEDPGVPDNINRLAQLLKVRGSDESQEEAWQIAMKGYESTGQYRFRLFAGDIRIEQAHQKLVKLRAQLDGNPDGTAQVDDARTAVLDLQHAEYTERVKQYPTDRIRKLQLGEILFQRADFNGAMQCFQEAKDEPRVRVRSGYMLGRCFASEGWHQEAIEEYQEALERVEPGDKDTDLSVRYDLMVSLMEQARMDSSLEIARESLSICSTIARKDITYRDIRECRRRLDELVRELAGPPPGS